MIYLKVQIFIFFSEAFEKKLSFQKFLKEEEDLYF